MQFFVPDFNFPQRFLTVAQQESHPRCDDKSR